tara:strand:- start:663 stop:1190 length:528 start_codon:yes stop_codon:yes gene_type:complete
MKKIKTKFKDLFVVNSRVFKDNRGWLKEEFKKKIVKKNLVFTVVSNSKKNVLRGLHMQTRNPQDKFLSVVKGRVLDVAVDLRKNSKTYGKHFKIILSEKNGKHLFVPKGFAHGILGLDKENILHYACTNYRDPKSEVSIKWNDTSLNINWGTKKPIISKKDKLAFSLEDFEKNRK